MISRISKLPKHAHDDYDDGDETMLVVTPATDDFLSLDMHRLGTDGE